MDFTPLNVAPPDPAYGRFLEGLHSVAADPAGKANQRWRGADQAWYTYDPVKWGMEDVGAANTPPEMALSEWGFPQATWKVQDFMVPQLFDRLKKAFATLSAAHPRASLVWAPWGGGTWRAAFERVPGTHPPPPPNGKVELPAEALKSIELVREFERRGKITHDQAQHIIEGIVAEHT